MIYLIHIELYLIQIKQCDLVLAIRHICILCGLRYTIQTNKNLKRLNPNICTEVIIVCLSLDMMQLQWITMIVWLNKTYFNNYMHRSKLYLYVSRGNNAILSLLQMHKEMIPFILHDVSDCVL